MANIKQFETPALGLRPVETGVEARAATARRIGAFYNQQAAAIEEVGSFRASEIRSTGTAIGSALKIAGDAYVNQLDHEQISHGTATFAQLQDDLTQQWNTTAKSADPNDPSVAAKFRESVLEPALDNFTEAFSTEKGQRWAEAHVAALRQHMFQKTAGDMSTLAGIAVAQNAQTAAKSMTNTAIQDPSSVPFLLESTDHSIAGIVSSSPTLSAADAK